MKHPGDALRRAARFTGVELTKDQLESLAVYGNWLIDEAIPAGGLGPEEAPRIVDRHLADSLVFAQWPSSPDTLVDVGSGVGLPGIPLAIVHPGIAVTLLDHSQRRADLAQRAVRILGLDATVVHEPFESHRETYHAATFRASLPPEPALTLAVRLLQPGGVAIVGLSRGVEPAQIPEPPSGAEIEVVETPEGILDSPAWHLRMTVR